MPYQISKIKIEEGKNFLTDGLKAKTENRIIMLLVSQTSCPYCVLIKEEIIFPMIRGRDFQEEILIREIFIDTKSPLVDFSGKKSTTKHFAKTYSATLTPTLLFLNGKGMELTERMLGINTPEMYFYYVSESIQQALNRI